MQARKQWHHIRTDYLFTSHWQQGIPRCLPGTLSTIPHIINQLFSWCKHHNLNQFHVSINTSGPCTPTPPPVFFPHPSAASTQPVRPLTHVLTRFSNICHGCRQGKLGRKGREVPKTFGITLNNASAQYINESIFTSLTSRTLSVQFDNNTVNSSSIFLQSSL